MAPASPSTLWSSERISGLTPQFSKNCCALPSCWASEETQASKYFPFVLLAECAFWRGMWVLGLLDLDPQSPLVLSSRRDSVRVRACVRQYMCVRVRPCVRTPRRAAYLTAARSASMDGRLFFSLSWFDLNRFCCWGKSAYTQCNHAPIMISEIEVICSCVSSPWESVSRGAFYN